MHLSSRHMIPATIYSAICAFQYVQAHLHRRVYFAKLKETALT